VIRAVGLGAGSHAKSVLDAIRSAGRFEVVALVDDDPAREGTEVLGHRVVGGADALERLRGEGIEHAFVGIGGVADNEARERAFARLVAAGFELPPIVHATAHVSPWARLGSGVHVLAGVVVNAAAEVEENVILNTGALVEHDCRIGAHTHVAPGVTLGGLVTVGAHAHVGIGATVVQGVRIGERALVAAGAVVIGDVEDGARVAGVPARPMSAA
jgi:sugar O-acyltransferase (sialic acid O-acetyltransferase NeuD family)